jgi:hypothetical protein
MSAPVVQAFINFSTGAVFAGDLFLNTGQLDINTLSGPTLIVDVSNLLDSIQTNRGRNAQADQFQTGTLTMRLVDQNGDFNPQNTNSPYYGLLSPMRKVTIGATFNNVDYDIFAGFITSYTTTTPKNALDVVYTTITAVDGFRLAQNAQISTVAGATAGDLSGTRITQILDAIAWPITQRDIDAGLTTMQADPGTARTALAAMQTVEISEYGALYCGKNGDFVFQDRAVTAGSAGGTPVVFNDDGSAIGYFNAIWRFDDTLVYNQANITRTGGTTQTSTNQASVDKYFLHSYNQQNLLMQTDAVALDYANSYVASRAETSSRCDAINLDLYTDNYTAGITAALDLDFFDPVTITTNQPGASTLTKTLQVFGISHAITPNSWKTTLTTLEPIIDGLILNSTIYGLLDSGVLSY